jgi:DNA polymerase-4
MPIGQAVKLCPHGIFLPGDHDKYGQVSHQIRQVFHRFSPIVENTSIDEAFLDMTGCEHLHDDLEDLGKSIKRAIYDAVALTASVGIGPNKFIAKLASDYRKPDGITIVAPEEVEDWLAPMAVNRIWGIGEKTTQVLATWQIRTIQDLRRCSQHSLVKRFGKQGLSLYFLARGIDNRPVEPETAAKSMGKETTFTDDIIEVATLRQVLANLVAVVGMRLRQQKLWARTITVKLRYSDFTTITRSISLPEPINSDDDIFQAADNLLKENIAEDPIRLIGIYVSQLTTMAQGSLFADPRGEKLTELMDKLNARYDRPVLRKGRELQSPETH